MKKKLISIITPVLNEEKNIHDCFKNVKKFFSKKKYNYEHIFVDNNSFDGSKDLLKKIAIKNKNIKVLINKKNYNILPSLFNALKFAKGDGILICYSADGQDPIKTLDLFLHYFEKGCDVISAQRVFRNENLIWSFLKFIYYFIYIVFNKCKNIRNNRHFFVNVFQFVNKNVLNKILKTKQLYPHLPSLCYIHGKKIHSLKSKWIKRKKGKSYNNFNNYFFEAIFCYFCFTYFFQFTALFTSIFILFITSFQIKFFYINILFFLFFYFFIKFYLIRTFVNQKIIISKKINI